jgi:hypothetical protein
MYASRASPGVRLIAPLPFSVTFYFRFDIFRFSPQSRFDIFQSADSSLNAGKQHLFFWFELLTKKQIIQY